MSTRTAVVCDGCETPTSQPRGIYPAGWLRLRVTGRTPQSVTADHLATVDVCSTACAARALEESAASVMPSENRVES
jgi:hypothetical protein